MEVVNVEDEPRQDLAAAEGEKHGAEVSSILPHSPMLNIFGDEVASFVMLPKADEYNQAEAKIDEGQAILVPRAEEFFYWCCKGGCAGVMPNQAEPTANICSCDGAVWVDKVSFPPGVGKSGTWVITNTSRGVE